MPKIKRTPGTPNPKYGGVKEFSECMWYGFAGASRWKSALGKTEPVFREVESHGKLWLFVADAECVQAYYDDDGQLTYGLDLAFPTQEAAKAFLRGIRPEFVLTDLGFKEI